MIDGLISVVVISLSSFGFLAASITSSALDAESRTVAVATLLTRRVLEEMQAVPLDDVIASYNANTTDDPRGAGTASGSTFTLETKDVRLVTDAYVDDCNLTLVDTTYAKAEASTAIPKSMDVSIMLPTTTTGAVEVLRENAIPAELGGPADLNGDGVIDGVDHSADYRILPVVIELQWPTADGGTRTVSYSAVLGGRGRS